MKSRNLLALALLLALVLPTTASAVTYSKARTRRIVAKYARSYDFGPKRTRWIKRAAIDIIYGPGAHESSGSTGCTTGSCVGIVQFDGGWHASSYEKRLARRAHVRDWRRSGTASLHRFVRSYRDGGKSAIRTHWKATLGR